MAGLGLVAPTPLSARVEVAHGACPDLGPRIAADEYQSETLIGIDLLPIAYLPVVIPAPAFHRSVVEDRARGHSSSGHRYGRPAGPEGACSDGG